MTIKLIFLGVISGAVWDGAGGSVVGLTYKDDFNFEQRYRNVDECDPFYWHPLHLPEHCADMYEQLIRGRLPVRLLKGTSNRQPMHVSPMQTYVPMGYQYSGNPVYESVIDEEETVRRELTPYEEMLVSVQKDVNNLPSVPSVKEMPNFGPVAVYQQPVSLISANMIKKVATTYSQTSDENDKKSRRKKSGKRWKAVVNTVRDHERNGWKKINNGDIVSLTRP